MIEEYGYEEYLRNAKNNLTKENLSKLANWFNFFGVEYWNGEGFVIDNNHLLKPIFDINSKEEYNCLLIIGWEIV